MFKPTDSFSGFSISDIEKTKNFYSEILDLKVEQDAMGLSVHLPSGATIFLYEKKDHLAATFTVLNFIVENIDQSLEELKAKGVEFIHYDTKNLPQDEKGILRGLKVGMGPDIAWFEDPSKNILSILQQK